MAMMYSLKRRNALYGNATKRNSKRTVKDLESVHHAAALTEDEKHRQKYIWWL